VKENENSYTDFVLEESLVASGCLDFLYRDRANVRKTSRRVKTDGLNGYSPSRRGFLTPSGAMIKTRIPTTAKRLPSKLS